MTDSNPDNFTFIRTLADAERVARERQEAAEKAIEERNRLIREASVAGLTRREVAGATGMTPGRIQQIVDKQGGVTIPGRQGVRQVTISKSGGAKIEGRAGGSKQVTRPKVRVKPGKPVKVRRIEK